MWFLYLCDDFGTASLVTVAWSKDLPKIMSYELGGPTVVLSTMQLSPT